MSHDSQIPSNEHITPPVALREGDVVEVVIDPDGNLWLCDAQTGKEFTARMTEVEPAWTLFPTGVIPASP